MRNAEVVATAGVEGDSTEAVEEVFTAGAAEGFTGAVEAAGISEGVIA